MTTTPNKKGAQKPPKGLAPFKPEGWQQRAWDDLSPILLLTGSAGGGKSRTAAEKVHFFLMQYPGATGLMLRKTREATTNSIVLFMQYVVMGRDNRIKHNQSAHRFEYPNGSMLVYGGMKDESQREQVRSVGLAGGVDIAWMEEATQFVEEDFNELLARMRGNAGGWRQIILTTNPDSPAHWIYQRLILKGQASVHLSHTKDNPYNPADYIENMQNMTGVQNDRLVKGLWVQAYGVVYSEFDASVHILDTLPNVLWKRSFASVDWGYTNPGVIHVWRLDYDGRMYLAKEIYQTQRDDDWWVEQAKQLKRQYDLDYFVCDPSEPGFIAKFNRNGLSAIPADNDIRPGIQVVKERLKNAKDGKPRIFFLRTANDSPDPELERLKRATGLLDEFTLYQWPKGKEGKSEDEKPMKLNDHASDSMRYAVVSLDTIGEPSIRRL